MPRLSLLLGLIAWSCIIPNVAGQTKLLDPKSFGFDIPPGKLHDPADERVVTADVDGQPVVAKTHVRIGDHRIVMLPDGQLVLRRPQEAQTTERPFAAISNEKLAERLQSGEFQDFQVKRTERYLYLYTCSDQFAFGTQKILESMLPGVKRYLDGLKISTHDPEVPLVVIMFKTEDDFQRYRRMPQGVVAYYDPLTNRVVVYEQSRRLAGRPDLLIQQAISTIAHEGTHQMLHNLGVQQRLSMWPMWLSEGMAEYLAPTSVDKKLNWKGPAEVNDLRMFELEQYVKSKATEAPNGDTIKHTVLASRLTSTGYATAWSLTHYLATQKKSEFPKYLAEVAKTKPLQGSVEVVAPGVVPGNAVLFDKYFGSNYVDLEKKLILHLRKQPYTDPFASMPHYVAMVAYLKGKRTKREANTFHSEALAAKWIKDAAAKNPAIKPEESLIREFANRPQAETFAKTWTKKGG